jgi:hypothetical protein
MPANLSISQRLTAQSKWAPTVQRQQQEFVTILGLKLSLSSLMLSCSCLVFPYKCRLPLPSSGLVWSGSVWSDPDFFRLASLSLGGGGRAPGVPLLSRLV